MVVYFKISVLTYLIFVVTSAHEVVKEKQWISDLFKYFQKSNTFQTLLFVDHENNVKYSKIKDLVSEISTKIPSKVIDFQKVTQELENNRFSTTKVLSLNSKSQIIIIQFLKTDLFEKINILNKLSGPYTRPRCLLILLDGEKIIYEKVLHYAWTKKFIDFTILELQNRESKKDNFLNNSLQYYPFEIAQLYSFNPFTQIYINKTYSTELQFFPDKLQDLNGHEIKVGSFNFPPSLYVKRNDSGYPVEVFGEDAKIVKAISEAMNFTICEVSSEDDWFGKSSCDKNKTEGLLRKLLHNEIQLFTNRAITIYICEQNQNEYEFGLSEPICYTWLTPILRKPTFSISFTMNRFYVIVLIVCLVIFIWIVLIFLKFDMYFWSLIYILEAVFGLTVPRTPEKLRERIVFCLILFAFWIHSSYLHAILTDVNVTTETELKTDTLENLYNSKLIPVMRKNSILEKLTTENDEMISDLLKNVQNVASFEKCIERLLKNRNVACFMDKGMANFFLKNWEQKAKTPLMRIGKECLFKTLTYMSLEPGSPFIRRINWILPRLRESGLFEKWKQDINVNAEFMEESKSGKWSASENVETVQMITILKVILATGYILSIFVFIGEMMMECIKRHFNY